jgi:hypothetical protein
MKSIRFRALPGVVMGALSLLACQASSIQLGVNGDAQVGSNYIDFGQYPSGGPYTPAPAYGIFQISLVNPGVFASAGVTPGEFGTIQSLNEGTGSITLPSAFMTFNGGGSNLQLWATSIPAGAVGPFVLTDTPDGAVASFNIEGYLEDTNTMTKLESFTGTFSATFDGESVAQLSTDLPVDTPFSATFALTSSPFTDTTAPESGSLLLLGIGLTSLAFVRFRRWR